MLSNLINKLKKMFEPESEQSKLDAFIARQQPTSVCDVEYWIRVYDHKQHKSRLHNLGFR